MRSFSSLILGLSALATAASVADCKPTAAAALPNCPPRPATPAEQRAILDDFIQAFYVKVDIEGAMTAHMAEDYIQHNPNVLSGRENSINTLKQFIIPGQANMTVLRTALDNNIAFVHVRDDSAGASAEPQAIVDVFRLDGTCIMEHWDVIQQRPANATNPLAMF
ncbi:snoal-like polyketide cyclase family protein [Colletotrichum plurivorum]|uniref:Snoal-like polyketide cyclase family protein n=1 Tax=Colletotrichum plurivorum TaxID=2175906 RepID=A0A8H6K9K9_9PEZI|nr:snoal-like polyketide cyclase family protein [Colletotrichum plurivorum]